MSNAETPRIAAMSDLELEDELREPNGQPDYLVLIRAELARRFSIQLLGDQSEPVKLSLKPRPPGNPLDEQTKPPPSQPSTPVRPQPTARLPTRTPPQPTLLPPFGPSSSRASAKALEDASYSAPDRGRRGRGVFVVVILLAILLAGLTALGITSHQQSTVSYSSSTQANTTTGSTSADWRRVMNGYCRRTLDPAFKAATGGSSNLPATAIPTVLPALASAQGAADRYLEAVAIPGEMAGAVRHMISSWDRMVLSYVTAATAYGSGDLEKAQTTARAGNAANLDANAVANELGLSDCAGAGGL